MEKQLSRRRLIQAATAAGIAVGGGRRARADEKPIRLGLVAPLSGTQQINGLPIRIGAEVARDEINRAGGIGGRQVELVIRDDKADPTQSVAAVRELTGDGVNLILGIPITSTAMAVSGIIGGLNGVYLATGTNEDKLTHELFNRNFFTTAVNSYTRSRAITRFIAGRYPDVTQWAGVFPDLTIGHDTWFEVSSGLKEFYPTQARKDVVILPSTVTKYGATDFKTQIAALMSSPAQGLYSILFGADGVTFFQQARQFGLDRKVGVIVDQALDVALGKALGHNIPNNVWSTSAWYPGLYPNNAWSQEFLKVWTAQTGDPYPGGIGALGHIAVMAYASAIRAAGGTDTDTIIAAMEGMTFPTLKGSAMFRKEDHQLIDDINVIGMGPKADPPGWEVKEMARLDPNEVINPPTPGKPLRA